MALRIINSKNKNKEDIMECEIYINDIKIDFNYFYIYPNKI